MGLKKRKKARASEPEVMRLALHTHLSLTTVRRWWRGEVVSKSTDWSLRAACKELKIRRSHEAA